MHQHEALQPPEAKLANLSVHGINRCHHCWRSPGLLLLCNLLRIPQSRLDAYTQADLDKHSSNNAMVVRCCCKCHSQP